MNQRELPHHFKFIVAAIVFPVTMGVLIYGGLWVANVKIDHGNMALLAVPVFVAFCGWVVVISQLPGAIAAWKNVPELRTCQALSILLLAGAIVLSPVVAFLVAYGF